MLIDTSNDENIPTHTEDYYEEIASQEDVYLEEREEELRAILTSHDPFPSRNSTCVLAENRGDRELIQPQTFVLTGARPQNATIWR
jgi:hypothetical protein